jgi:LCP family protein required for cell wall assembly
VVPLAYALSAGLFAPFNPMMTRRERRRQSQRQRLFYGWLVGLPLAVGAVVALYPTPLEQRPIGPAASNSTAPKSPQTPAPASPSPAPNGLSLLPQPNEPANILILACDVDYETHGGKTKLGLRGNTDSILFARLDPPHQQLRVLSIPRDTRVRIPGHGTFKINAANPYGGPALAELTVSNFLGVTPQRYVLLNTRAVVQLVDAMGGVNVNVPKRMDYDDNAGRLHIHFKRGVQFMHGQQAQEFLRFRHDDKADIGRVERLQAFFQAALAQYLTPLNMLKTPHLLAVAQENMESDMNLAEMLAVASWAQRLGHGGVSFGMVPGEAAYVGKVAYWLPSERGTKAAVAKLMGVGLSKPAPQ